MTAPTPDLPPLPKPIYSIPQGWDGSMDGFDPDQMRAYAHAAILADRAAGRALEAVPEKWQPIETAPRDGTIVRLLVNFTEHPLEDDDSKPLATIGGNSLDNTGEDKWQFAGWSWIQDCFTEGEGEVVGWLPMISPAASPEASQEEHVAIVEMYVTGPSSMTATLTQAGNLLARGLHKLYAHPALPSPVPANMRPMPPFPGQPTQDGGYPQCDGEDSYE